MGALGEYYKIAKVNESHGARYLGPDTWGRILGAGYLGLDTWGRILGAGYLGPDQTGAEPELDSSKKHENSTI